MDNEASIRAIIFDLGGVILRTDDPQPRLALARRMGMTRRELEGAVFDHLASQKAEVGGVTPAQAWEAIAQGIHLPVEEIPAFREQFFAGDKVDFRLIEFIQRLRPRYTTGLLSNTWIVDLPAFLRDDLNIPDRTFDAVISSARHQVAKPDPAIFRLALEAVQAAPHEAIFVDDFLKNITAAAALGIRTVHFRDAQQAMDEIRAILGDGGER
jgi:epoxide hydrolase-like predicted phosphatase